MRKLERTKFEFFLETEAVQKTLYHYDFSVVWKLFRSLIVLLKIINFVLCTSNFVILILVSHSITNSVTNPVFELSSKTFLGLLPMLKTDRVWFTSRHPSTFNKWSQSMNLNLTTTTYPLKFRTGEWMSM